VPEAGAIRALVMGNGEGGHGSRIAFDVLRFNPRFGGVLALDFGRLILSLEMHFRLKNKKYLMVAYPFEVPNEVPNEVPDGGSRGRYV
jgi:hypothetical protein